MFKWMKKLFNKERIMNDCYSEQDSYFGVYPNNTNRALELVDCYIDVVNALIKNGDPYVTCFADDIIKRLEQDRVSIQNRKRSDNSNSTGKEVSKSSN